MNRSVKVSMILGKLFLKVDKFSVSLIFLILLSLFLRIYNLSQGMIFIGDQGWFYLSARDLLLNGHIPLVGITSSHTWLHQGPLWTYMLSVALWLFNFNPLAGACVTILFGTLAMLLMYKLGSIMFSEKIGIIAAALFAVSPLIVTFDRMPFDPSPIPFFTILYFYAIFKWLKGSRYFFPLILFLIAVLYNLELATFTLFIPFVLFLIYGFTKKESYFQKLLNLKTIIYSLIALILPMIPVIIYDFSNGFKQTAVFIAWIIYKPFSFLIKHSSTGESINLKNIYEFIALNVQQLIFKQSLILSMLIFIFSVLFLIYSVIRMKKIKVSNSRLILLMLLGFSLFGIVINQTPSAAYLPIIFPFMIFSIALLIDALLKIKKISYLVITIFVLFISINTYSVIQDDKNNGFETRLNAVDKVISLTKNKSYNLIGVGAGSQFSTFTMNYEYLLWWKGHTPSKNRTNLKIYITETPKGIIINKKDD